ncbi:hypothetical protein AnigIFM56816_008788 [Aspergillus niger]|nr:hypothetical protein AnigIFM56816_008788 [Aspergillus niger]
MSQLACRFRSSNGRCSLHMTHLGGGFGPSRPGSSLPTRVSDSAARSACELRHNSGVGEGTRSITVLLVTLSLTLIDARGDEKLCETRINNCARVGYVVGQDNQDKSHSPGDGGIWNAVSHPPCADGLISRSVAAWRSSSSSILKWAK